MVLPAAAQQREAALGAVAALRLRAHRPVI